MRIPCILSTLQQKPLIRIWKLLLGLTTVTVIRQKGYKDCKRDKVKERKVYTYTYNMYRVIIKVSGNDNEIEIQYCTKKIPLY